MFVRTYGNQSSRRRWAPAALGALFAVLVLVSPAIAAPTGAASTPPHKAKVTLVAPFNGTWSAYSGRSSPRGCANSTVLTTAQLNTVTGGAAFGANASAEYCKAGKVVGQPSIVSSAGNGSYLGAWVTIPFFSGFPAIYANFSYRESVTANLRIGTCKLGHFAVGGTCSGSVSAYFEVNSMDLIDTTNGSSHLVARGGSAGPIGAFVTSTTTCIRTSGCSTTSSGSNTIATLWGTLSFEMTPTKRMLKTHTYALAYTVFFAVSAGVWSTHAKMGPTSAYGNLDVASGRNGVVLTRLVEVY